MPRRDDLRLADIVEAAEAIRECLRIGDGDKTGTRSPPADRGDPAGRFMNMPIDDLTAEIVPHIPR